MTDLFFIHTDVSQCFYLLYGLFAPSIISVYGSSLHHRYLHQCIIIFLWCIFILSVITYYIIIMVICIIIHHPYIYLLFRLPLSLQRLQVILFYFIVSHITLHVFLVTPHDTLFMIISVSTCFIVSYWVFVLYISLLLLVLLLIIPTSCTRILLVICYSIIIGSVCHSDMHFPFDYSFMIAYYMYYCHDIISCCSQLHYIYYIILYYYHRLTC